MHIALLRGTFGKHLMKIFQRVQKIWSGHEIEGTLNCDLDLESG